MFSRYTDWLTLSARDGRGGASAEPPSVVRGFGRTFRLNLGLHEIYGDFTAGTFSAVAGAGLDSGASPLATWTAETGTPSGGVTPIVFTIEGDEQTTVPADIDVNGIEELAFQITYTLGGNADPIIQSVIKFAGAV